MKLYDLKRTMINQVRLATEGYVARRRMWQLNILTTALRRRLKGDSEMRSQIHGSKPRLSTESSLVK
jgi:hypothetical protein